MNRRHIQTFYTVFFLAALVVKALPVQAIEYLHADWRQGGLVIGKLEAGASLQLNGEPVMQGEDGIFVIGFGRYAPETAILKQVSASGESVEYRFSVEQREFDIQYIEGISKKIMSPDENDLKRIAADAERVRQARERRDSRDNFSQGFTWPILGPVTGVYGSQRYYNGVPKSPHYGVDVAASEGAAVRAPAPGIVTLADADQFYSGGTLIIDHGHGLSSTFLHLSRLLVEVGQRVETGDLIAEVGATGRATGAHLDWRMNWFQERIDPELLVPPMQQMQAE